jgi:hypothetical protein
MTAVDSLDSILEAASETGAVVAVPGLLNWLGRKPHTVDPDFKKSIDGGFTESFEDYCQRISKEKP